MSWRRRAAWSVGGSLATFVVAGALLHAPFARPWLAKVGGCPVGNASAAEIESVRLSAVAKTRGDVVAPARPALGFVLDETTPEAVHAWAKRHDVTCDVKRDGLFVSCRDVPLVALEADEGREGSVSDVSFAFRPSDRTLVNVTATTFALTPREAAARTAASAASLRTTLGAPTSEAGQATEEALGRGGYATAIVAYRFSDLLADVTTTSFDRTGVTVREHYLSARD